MTNNKISGTRCGCDLPDDICSEEMERCVLCLQLTNVPQNTPISLRKYYVQGQGQLCAKCYYELCKQGAFFDEDNVNS